MLQDPDSSVRAALLDAIGCIASGMHAVTGSPAPGDAPGNALLKDIFESMMDMSHHSQETAAAALIQVTPSAAATIVFSSLAVKKCCGGSLVSVTLMRNMESNTLFKYDSSLAASWNMREMHLASLL